jgi:hypothetical protein
VHYYSEHRDDYAGKSLEDVFGIIRSKLRENKISQLRSDLAQRLCEQYQPVIHEEVVQVLLKEEK